MASVYQAGDAFFAGCPNLLHHEIEIAHEIWTIGWWGLRWRWPGLRLWVLSPRQRDPLGHEIRREGQMLMEERRAAGQRFGRQVLQDGANDRAGRGGFIPCDNAGTENGQ